MDGSCVHSVPSAGIGLVAIMLRCSCFSPFVISKCKSQHYLERKNRKESYLNNENPIQSLEKGGGAVSAALIAYGIANGWIKKSVPTPVTPDLEQKRTIIRESMRRLRARRHAQGLTSHGTERVRRENVPVLCSNLKRAWKEEFK